MSSNSPVVEESGALLWADLFGPAVGLLGVGAGGWTEGGFRCGGGRVSVTEGDFR
jgi:hypothetical protein